MEIINDTNKHKKKSNLISNTINSNKTIPNLWEQSNEKVLQWTEKHVVLSKAGLFVKQHVKKCEKKVENVHHVKVLCYLQSEKIWVVVLQN